VLNLSNLSPHSWYTNWILKLECSGVRRPTLSIDFQSSPLPLYPGYPSRLPPRSLRMLSRPLWQPTQHRRRRMDQSGSPRRVLHRGVRGSHGGEMAYNAGGPVGGLEEQVGLAVAAGPDPLPENGLADLALAEGASRCGRARPGLCAGFGNGFDGGRLAVERGEIWMNDIGARLHTWPMAFVATDACVLNDLRSTVRTVPSIIIYMDDLHRWMIYTTMNHLLRWMT
jgi:hypothetical protein